MSEATKNILYTTANSRAYANGAGGGMVAWKVAISAVVILATVVGEVMLVRSAKKKRALEWQKQIAARRIKDQSFPLPSPAAGVESIKPE